MEIKRFGDFIICPIPDENELDQVEIEQIVTHTHNTWQHNRPIQEIRENTIQGKRAEIVIENILRDNSTFRFLAYDKMRRDNFSKHAPFDGIEFITDKTRSMPERLFERYCETRADKIEWVYKNGDTGQQYLSIVYLDGFLKQWLFYPDYVVKTNDGQVWLIETKGGEVAGHSKNIDIQVENKFIAFKQYAEKYKLNFGFVRDINEDLFINNTEYQDDMSHDSWRPLSELL